MPTLLHIDSSPRGDYSISRKLSAAFVDEWKGKHPDGKIIRRDLLTTELPFVDIEWIGGAYSAPEQHTPQQAKSIRISDALVAELLEADEVVIGAPMYNFAVPANLKAYIDHIVRFGKTFNVSEKGYEGLAKGKKATFIVSSGGNYSAGGPAEKYNAESPYLQAIFGFMGFADTKVVLAGDTNDVTQGKVQQLDYLSSHVGEVKAAV